MGQNTETSPHMTDTPLPVIRRLSESVANQIAAGEVVERPASVVKELVENSIDAYATRIAVSIREGGLAEIRVTDDGVGLPADQVSLAFERHATSKIRTAEDLFAIHTLGFRGEALPSIASVAYVTMQSKPRGARMGTVIRLEGGKRTALEPKGMPDGTTVIVEQLFYNTPARRKFLKSESAERRAVTELLTRLALAHPAIQFVYEAEGREVFRTPGDGKLLSAVSATYGHALAKKLLPLERAEPFGTLRGLVSPPSEAKGTRQHLTFFVNGRWIESRALATAVERGYANLLPVRRYPMAVIKLEVDPAFIDVNVHPAKTEIRFRDERAVFSAVMHAVRDALLSANLIPGHAGTARLIPSRPPGDEEGPDASVDLFPKRKVRPRDEVARIEWRRVSAIADVQDTAEAPAVVDSGFSRYEVVDITTGEVRERPAAPEESRPAHWRAPFRTVPLEDAAPSGAPDAASARRALREAKVLGQVLNTYIIVPVPWGLWLVDQHVAHERILFEQTLRAAEEQGALSQPLLVPQTVDLSVQALAAMEELGDELGRMGFGFEYFGGQSILVRAVPPEFSSKTHEVGAVFEELAELYTDDRLAERLERLASMVACKSAVKAGEVLPVPFMESLLRRLSDTENPFACPHGRPIVVEISQSELERRFGRR